MTRVVEPEWLDELPSAEPSAIHSRADLRRLNWIMNHAGILARALRPCGQPKRVMDLGCGDGTLALRLTQLARWHNCEMVLVDRSPVIARPLHDGFAALGCSVTVIQCDVLEGLASAGPADAVFTNLFLHHFDNESLRRVLQDVAARCRVFAACEPQRSSLALLASRLVGLIGCNAVTRHDAAASVRAGFREREISSLWPTSRGWQLQERPAGMFSRSFVAQKL